MDSFFDDRDNDGGVEWWQTTGQKLLQERDQMPIILRGESPKEKNFDPLPAGSHPARCYAVVDLGTQKTEFMGKAGLSRKIRISWEVPSERMSDGRPFTISKQYKASIHEKATLRRDLTGWRNKDFTEAEIAGFDARNLLGKTCILAVKHVEKDGRTYANVGGVSPLAKGMEVGKPENEPIYFDLEHFDEELFAKLPQYAQDIIALSPEFAGRSRNSNPAASLDDDIPF